jgi:hypothetical protein
MGVVIIHLAATHSTHAGSFAIVILPSKDREVAGVQEASSCDITLINSKGG